MTTAKQRMSVQMRSDVGTKKVNKDLCWRVVFRSRESQHELSSLAFTC